MRHEIRTKLSKTFLVVSFVILLLSVGNFIYSSLVSRPIMTAGAVVSVQGIEVYWDSTCMKPVSTIKWGTIGAGRSASKEIYLYNKGYTPITVSLYTFGWFPLSTEGYLELTWDLASEVESREVRRVLVTLSVFQNVTGITNFMFYIGISGSG